MTSECGAPEFFGGGLKLVGLRRRRRPDQRRRRSSAALERRGMGRAASRQPVGAVAHAGHRGRHDLLASRRSARLPTSRMRAASTVHMDGARFANAVARARAYARREATWKAGVDVLSFGATKGGAMAAEAVIFFDPARADGMDERRKRGGHLVSKHRFVAAQFEAFLADGLWLEAGAARQRDGGSARRRAAPTGLAPVWPVEANLVFVVLPAELHKRLPGRGRELLRDASPGSAPSGVQSRGRRSGAPRHIVLRHRARDVDRFVAAVADRIFGGNSRQKTARLSKLCPNSHHQTAVGAAAECATTSERGVPQWRSAVKAAYAGIALALSFASPLSADRCRGSTRRRMLRAARCCRPTRCSTSVRSMGLEPADRPVLRGRVYVLRAVDAGQREKRVVVDARTGEVVGARRGRRCARRPPYDRASAAMRRPVRRRRRARERAREFEPVLRLSRCFRARDAACRAAPDAAQRSAVAHRARRRRRRDQQSPARARQRRAASDPSASPRTRQQRRRPRCRARGSLRDPRQVDSGAGGLAGEHASARRCGADRRQDRDSNGAGRAAGMNRTRAQIKSAPEIPGRSGYVPIETDLMADRPITRPWRRSPWPCRCRSRSGAASWPREPRVRGRRAGGRSRARRP